MKHILQPGDGETLKLGPPAAGEIVIKVDPGQSGGSFAMGTETLLPGAALPVHRHLHQDEVLFVHKGQGRATLDSGSMTVVPGSVIYAPRAGWHGLRNTGTGTLQITWVASPSGIEAFFRDLSRLGSSVDASVLREIAQRHGVEFRPDGEPGAPQAPGRGRRHRRRGGHGRGRSGQPLPQEQRSQSPVSAQPAPAATPQPSLSVQQRPPGRGRRRHRRGGSGSAAQAVRPATAQQPAAQPPAAPRGTPTAAPPTGSAIPRPSSAGSGASRGGVPSESPKPKPGLESKGRSRGSGERRRRFGRVKEVYMGGRWVRVVGEGPVISTGRDASAPEQSGE